MCVHRVNECATRGGFSFRETVLQRWWEGWGATTHDLQRSATILLSRRSIHQYCLYVHGGLCFNVRTCLALPFYTGKVYDELSDGEKNVVAGRATPDGYAFHISSVGWLNVHKGGDGKLLEPCSTGDVSVLIGNTMQAAARHIVGLSVPLLKVELIHNNVSTWHAPKVLVHVSGLGAALPWMFTKTVPDAAGNDYELRGSGFIADTLNTRVNRMEPRLHVVLATKDKLRSPSAILPQPDGVLVKGGLTPLLPFKEGLAWLEMETGKFEGVCPRSFTTLAVGFWGGLLCGGVGGGFTFYGLYPIC